MPWLAQELKRERERERGNEETTPEVGGAGRGEEKGGEAQTRMQKPRRQEGAEQTRRLK